MELRFIALAIRRFWWLIVSFAGLGVLVATLVGGSGVSEYESEALLLVRPSTSSVSPALASQPDRYVLSQISVLESTAIAQSVAEILGGDESALSVRRSAVFTQRDETDIVEVKVRTNEPIRSQNIAQAYVNSYLIDTEMRTEALFEPERVRLTEELDAVASDLAAVNEILAAAAEPYLRTLGTNQPVPVPDIRVLSPAAATNQSLLLEDTQRINAALNNLELSARQAVQSEIIQTAPVPTSSVGDPTVLVRIAAVFILTLLGAVFALLASRFSATVIDESDIVSRLGQPIEGQIPFVDGLDRAPAAAIGSDDEGWLSELDQLASRVELASTVDGARIVAVGGSMVGAGSSTLSIGLAARFAQRGSRTVLIDADTTRATVTTALGAPTNFHLADISNQRPGSLGKTSIPNLITLGTTIGDSGRRIDGRAIARALRSAADVVVIDIGPILESVSASQLAAGVDQLVLAIPEIGQRHDGLEQIARVYGAFAEQLLPVVVTTPSGRMKFGGSSKFTSIDANRPTGEELSEAA